MSPESVFGEEEERELVSPREAVQTGDGFTCDECGREFGSAAAMKRHQTRSHGAEPAPKTPRSPRGPRSDPLKEQAEAFTMFFYGLGGQIFAQVDPVCGQALSACQPAATDAWYRAAKQNKYVRKMLAGTGQVGVWGGLVFAHMPLLLAVQQHHLSGAVPHDHPEPALS